MSLPRSSFGSVCHLVNGKAFKPTDWSGAGVPIIRIQNLNGPDKPFNYWASALDNQVLVKTGDLLLAWSGTPGTSFGAHIWSGPHGILNQHIFRCDLDQKAITKEWARIAVNHRLHRLIEQAHGGVGLQHVTRGMVEDLEIPLPPLAEQRRIAEVLDRAEALRAKRRAVLTQLDSLTQSLFLDLFGDTRKERTRWPTVPLEEIVRETKLGLVRGSQEFGPDFPIPYVRMNAITRNGELELAEVQRTHATEAEIEAYRLEPGDFLFNTRNSEELVGKTALYRGGGLHLFNNNVMRIRFAAQADSEFVAAAFKTAFVQRELNLRKSGTTNVFAIYYKDLRSLPLPLPPIELQREFARRVGAVEKLKTAQRASLAELDALFASLQHRAFRGEL